MHLDYVEYIRAESARFSELLRTCDPARPVPSCPDWDASDLLWHLTEVQAFWGEIVASRAQSPEEVPKPDRPPSHSELVDAFQHWSDYLVAALEDADDATPVWTWAEDHSVAFIRRRQAHEALIHRLDAELVTGQVTPLPSELAADGVLEVLDVMYGGCPPWGSFTPDGRGLVVSCTDTGDQMEVMIGRFTGTDPADGTSYDEVDLSVGTLATSPQARVSATADDLDSWMWHRRDASGVTFEGDQSVLDVLLQILEHPID